MSNTASYSCWLFATLAAVVGVAEPARAHDVPDRFFDRAIQVTVEPGRVHVSYELSLTQLTLAEELLALVGAGGLSGADAAERRERYAAEMAPLLARGLIVRVDGREVPFGVMAKRQRLEEHPKFTFEFAAAIEGDATEPRRLKIEDTSFFLEKGRCRIAIRPAANSAISESNVPAELADVKSLSSWELTPEQQDAARRAEAMWRARADDDPSPPTPLPASGARGVGSEGNLNGEPETTRAPGAARGDEDLVSLLDPKSQTISLILLGMAFFFGAAHALTPGHGKTMVAAYLVGERGTMRHAVALGLTTSLTHTGSVLIVAAILAFVSHDLDRRLTSGLSLVSGVLVAVLGASLLIARLRRPGGFGFFHSDCDHDHSDCNDHSANARDRDAAAAASDDSRRPTGPSWAGILTFGVSGGIVPCVDAVALLLFAAVKGELIWAFYLLLAFSAGLACTLVAIGVLAVKLRGFLSSRIGSGRIVRVLPVVSAAAIFLVGVVWCVQALWPARTAAPLAAPVVSGMMVPRAAIAKP